jgi:hypothetical protein
MRYYKMRDLINLFEDAPVQGELPALDLAKMLPDVNNPQLFQSGIFKVENGQEDQLTIGEKAQLALAFISLIKLDDNGKLKVIQKMNPVYQAKQPAQQQQVQ